MKVYISEFEWGRDWVTDIPYMHLLLKYPNLASDIVNNPHRWCVKCEELYCFCKCLSNCSDENYPVINVTQLKE